MRTAKDWLAVYRAGDLPLEAAKVLVPENEREHDFPEKRNIYPPFNIMRYKPCRKCGRHRMYEFKRCHLPGPIKLNWNTAMEWRDKIKMKAVRKFMVAYQDVFEAECGGPTGYANRTNSLWLDWWILHAQPKHYIIAACLAAEQEKK